MPLLGYLLGTQFKDYITSIDHWIAFGLLSLIGINMIKESKNTCEITDEDDTFSLKSLTVMAFATSIDALAIGVTLHFCR